MSQPNVATVVFHVSKLASILPLPGVGGNSAYRKCIYIYIYIHIYDYEEIFLGRLRAV